jgi:hypothetical protein
MAGGAVTASGLQILNTQGVGALVSGGAMLLEDSVVIGGTSDPGGEASGGVAVVDGGLFEGRRLLVSDVVGPGISSVGHGSRVVLEDVEVEGVRPAQPGFGSGLEVAGEAHAEARGLTVRDCQPHGVSVTKHHVYEGAPTLLLEDATIEGTSAAAADGVTDQCIVATEAAGLVLRRVEASGCTWAGLEITGWAGEQPALLEDVTIRDIDPGQVGLGIGAALIEAPATLVRLEIEDVYAIGLFASGPLAAVTVQDSAIHRVEQGAEEGGGVGLVSQYMARVTATGLVTEHNDGPGIYALARGNIDCQDCIARGNGFAGVAVTDGGALRLTGGTIEASPATLTHGGGVGLFAWRSGDGPWLSMHGVEIRGHLGPAVYLRGRGTYLLRDSVFDGNGTSAWSPAGGVLALDVFDRWDPDYPDATDGGLMLSGNTFSDTDHDAVLLHAATASFYDNDWNQAADALDVRRQACDGVPPLDLYGAGPTQNDCEGPAIEVSPALEYRLEIEEAGLEE